MTKTAKRGYESEPKGLHTLVMGRCWLDKARGFLLKGNTLLYQAGKVEQRVQTLGESLARQSGAEPTSLRQRLTLEFQGTLKLSGCHSFV